jgi:hypothetical protein
MGSCRPVAFGVNAQIFPDWAKLAKIASTIPVSSVPAERAFSLQNRIKTSIRNRLAEEKVTRLMRISSLGPGLKDFNFSRAAEHFHAMKLRQKWPARIAIIKLIIFYPYTIFA